MRAVVSYSTHGTVTIMSSSLGLEVVSRVDETDRFPFLKALAHIAIADDSVTLDEKEMVEQYVEAWDLGSSAESEVRDILESGSAQTLGSLVSEFSETGTRFLLLQELMRLAYADGTYGDVERRRIATIAEKMSMTKREFQEVEEWVERGQAWGSTTDEDRPGQEDLEGVLGREDDADSEHDLSDIETGDSDLSDIGEDGFSDVDPPEEDWPDEDSS